MSGYTDRGKAHYMLYRAGTGTPQNKFKYEIVHEFDTPEELNRMVKLLLEG